MDRDDAILDYLQDRLAPEKREAFETSMAQDASLAAEVDLMRSVRDEMASGPTHEKADAVWEQLSTAMDAPPQAANENRHPWVSVLQYAAVAAIAVAAWQFAVVPRLGDVPDGFRAASEQSAGFVLQVKFEDSVTIGEIGTLLGPLGGTISDGPSALGVVRVSFTDAALRDAAREVLTARSDIVELVLDQ
ncbi:MAG: hypothetical protein AAFW87_03080 [Pseudomonadota bacterium]